MTDTTDALEHAKALHQNQQFAEAKQAYLTLLKQQHEPDARLLNLLGMLSFQEHNYIAASDYFQQAIDIAPPSATLQCHLGNSFRARGDYPKAIACYQHALTLDPHTPIALNNLGVCYYHMGHVEKAAQHYQEAIKHRPDFIDAHYNLGNSLLKLAEQNHAEDCFQQTLRHCPKHFGALFQLGRLKLSQDNAPAALAHFQQAVAIEENHLELQCNLGHSYLKTGELHHARTHYRKALSLDPNQAELYFNLGVLAERENYLDHAIGHYQQAIALNADYGDAHHNLGVVFIHKNHPANALHHLKKALALSPDNASLHYNIQSLEQDPSLEAAPEHYIKDLFNGYAEHYDNHLCQALEYQLPQQLLDISQITKVGTVLDLGCGTGLCGQAFKPHCQHLTGVDLAAGMLAKAHQKNCYDKLYEQDLTAFLTECKHRYDLIVAGDVLVYFGKLDVLLGLCAKRLHPRGKLLFNVEYGEQMPYRIDQSGRFKHHEAYIEQLAHDHQLTLIDKQLATTRMQNNQPVNGIVYYWEAN